MKRRWEGEWFAPERGGLWDGHSVNHQKHDARLDDREICGEGER